MLHCEYDLPNYCMCWITILGAAALATRITAKEHACKSQHETILADLNWYTTKTLQLLIIVTDDAIKYVYMYLTIRDT